MAVGVVREGACLTGNMCSREGIRVGCCAYPLCCGDSDLEMQPDVDLNQAEGAQRPIKPQ